jgi:hypothetical protein
MNATNTRQRPALPALERAGITMLLLLLADTAQILLHTEKKCNRQAQALQVGVEPAAAGVTGGVCCGFITAARPAADRLACKRAGEYIVAPGNYEPSEEEDQ